MVTLLPVVGTDFPIRYNFTVCIASSPGTVVFLTSLVWYTVPDIDTMEPTSYMTCQTKDGFDTIQS